MTDPQPSSYRATADDWLNAETMAAHDSGNGYYALRCILELRARVDALEARVSELQSCHNTTADHRLDIIAMVRGTASAEAKPAPAGSLVERVHSCIVGEPECGHMQASAAIREVAAWMRENECGYNAVRWLEQEADRG